MSKFHKLSFTLLLTCFSLSSYAAVFKCEENGNISFSDKPCNSNASDITHQQLNLPAAKQTPSEKSKSRFEKSKNMADSMESARLQKELKLEIKSLENEIVEIKSAHKEELLILNKERDSIGEEGDYDDELTFIELKNNITDKINKTNEKHSTETEEVEVKLKTLRAKLDTKKE